MDKRHLKTQFKVIIFKEIPINRNQKLKPKHILEALRSVIDFARNFRFVAFFN